MKNNIEIRPNQRLDFSNVRHELSKDKDHPLLTFAQVQSTNPRLEIGNKGSLGTILSIGLAIALPALAPMIPGLGFLGTAMKAAKWYSGIVTAGLGLMGGFIGGAIGNMISPPAKPSFGNLPSFGGNSSFADSPTFSLNGIQNTRTPDGPLAIIYGTRRVGGILISQRLESIGDDTFLWALFALGEGEVESICAAGLSDMRINGQSGSNFDDVTLWTRTGTKIPTVIPGFEELISSFSVGTKVVTSVTYTTNGASVIGAKLNIQAANGLYTQSDTGNIVRNSVTYHVEYRVNPAGGWNDLGTQTFEASKVGVVKDAFKIESLAADKYDFRVTRISVVQSGARNRSDIWLQSIDEMTGDEFLYPHTALAAVKVKATNQLNGPIPTFTFLVKGLKILDVSNLGNPKAWSDNPADAYYDLLTNARYGLGRFVSTADVNATKIAVQKVHFNTTATDGAGGTEIRSKIDMVIDVHSDAQQLLMQMMTGYRAAPLWSEGLTSLIVDKSASHVHIFNMGNVERDSYSSSFPDIKASPNRIVVQYADATNDYKMNTVSVTDDTAITSGAPIRTEMMMAPGIVRKSEAYRYANYRLNLGIYIKRALEFTVPPEALDLQAGDLFLFQHDVPQWGRGGRIESANGTTIVVDQEIVIGGGSYLLQVRLADGSLEEKVVINSAGTTKVIELSSAFTTNPAPYAPYFFGASIDKKIWTCSMISMNADGNRRIAGIEYNSNVYTEIAQNPTHNATNLISPETIPNDVENLTLLEGGDKAGGMIVSFNLPDPAGSWNHAIVYFSSDGGNTYSPHTPVQGADDVEISNLVIGQQYFVKVISYTLTDVQSTSPPVTSLIITGAAFLPQVIRGLEIIGQGNNTEFNGTDVTFEWKSNNPIFGAGIETASNDNLGAGQGEFAPTFKDFKVNIYVSGISVRVSFPKDNKFIYTHQMNIEDNGGIGVRAFQIRVAERNGFNATGGEAILDVSNPIPDMSGHTPTVTTNLAKQLMVDWGSFISGDADLQGYKIYVDTSNPPTTLVGEVGSDTKQFLTAELIASTLYYAKIIPYDVFGAGTVSGVQSKTNSDGLTVADGSITTAKLATNAVTTVKVTDDAITIKGAAFTAATTGIYSSTTWSTIQSVTLTLDSAQEVLVIGKCMAAQSVAGATAAVYRLVHTGTGTQIGYNQQWNGHSLDSGGPPLMGIYNTVSSGSHTFNMQHALFSAGGGQIISYQRGLAVIQMRK